MVIAELRFLFLACLLAMAAACGGGGGGGSATGSLALTVAGLPAGADAAVTVSGPGGFAQSVKSTQTLTGLNPGAYTVSAANAQNGATPYTPQPAAQNVGVSAGMTANAMVTYTAQASIVLGLRQVATGLSSPLFLTAPANDARLFIVEQPGTIRIVKNGQLLPTPFLDISTLTSFSSGTERGLLSMVFHPQYATNGLFFVYYTDVNGNIAVYRFNVFASDPDLADPTSGVRVLSIARDPANSNHNGGLLAFGPDGFLYVGTGDGGGAGDPPRNAQNLNTLLGKLLRIDVSNTSPAQGYSVPASNPFVNQAGRRGEIWAYGLRNPWRYAFDAGLLYIADVGQDRREEVDVAATSLGGLNYGWNVMEGSLCYPSDPCDKTGLTLPVFDYDHGVNDANGCAITGGYVYRGSAIPELQGRYFYSDYCAGWLKSFVHRSGTATEQTDWNITNVGQILSFGEDAQNELYMLSATGNVYQIIKQ